jgi:hypothetical protein
MATAAAADGGPTPSSTESSSSSGTTHRLLWLSDVHLDPRYGTPLAFTAPYYDGADCYDASGAPSGKYGCDSPPVLVRGALDAAVAVAARGGEGVPRPT